MYEHATFRSEERERLHTVKVEFDCCWDLLPRRRALRETGQDPEQVPLGAAGVVEYYLQ